MTERDLVRLTVQVTPQQKQALKELSQRQVVPISAIVRALINEKFNLLH